VTIQHILILTFAQYQDGEINIRSNPQGKHTVKTKTINVANSVRRADMESEDGPWQTAMQIAAL